MSFWHKKSGFTLAELLIAIGLLGSVAALTIPTLAYNYRGKVLEQQFRSTYSEVKEIGSRMNYENGDVGEFAYKCVYVSAHKCGPQTAAGKNLYSGTNRWSAEFMSYLPGGAPFNKDANSGTGISQTLRKIYKDAGSPQGPRWFSSNSTPGIVCDNGGIWTDSKGRLWTFNGENQFVCVDINGTAAPNRMNVDTFIFKPMTAKEVAIYINNENPDDPHVTNYSGQFVLCDINKISNDNWGNKMPSQTGYRKGSGSAVDWCYFNEPIENIAAMDWADRLGNKKDTGTSAGPNGHRKTLTRNNNYWTDYINYR